MLNEILLLYLSPFNKVGSIYFFKEFYIFSKSYHRSPPLTLTHIVILVMIQAIVLPVNNYAQSIGSDVVNGFGSTFTIENQTFGSSVGELAITTFTANGFSITQGFLQPISLKIPCTDVVLKAFPNPVLTGIKIYAEGCDVEITHVQTYDLFGKMVYEAKPVNNQINFSSIGVGVYLVRAYDMNNNVVGVVKIIKSTI